MTTYATRSPLQLLTNSHMMSDSRRITRRTSARIADKEDVPVVNGNGYTAEKGKGVYVNGVSAKHGKAAVNGAGRAKRKIDYDEEDDGFMFTRTRSKRAKAAPSAQSHEPPMENIQEEAPKLAIAKKPRKNSVRPGSPKAADVEKEIKEVKRRRSPRNSGDGIVTEPPVLEVKKRRTKENGASKPKSRKSDELQPIIAGKQPDESAGTGEMRSKASQVDTSRDTTKIALPFADTPIIRRNQEMRRGAGDGSRRSSLGLRGRRASSLIDGGKSNALPHDEVGSSEFYKHIESGLPEPRRMRQLLTWCGTRALVEKPSFAAEDSHAKLAAREIQQQLLKDFSTKSSMSDWFSREDTALTPQPPKPNPKNVANLVKIQELEQQIARLQSERQTWSSLIQPPPPEPQLPHLSATTIPTPETISSTHLSPADAALLSTLTPSTNTTSTSSQTTHQPDSLTTTTAHRLHHITESLEFKIDVFAQNIHLLDRLREGADGVASSVLGAAAEVLEERARGEGKEGVGVGVRGVLRGLSRVLEDR